MSNFILASYHWLMRVVGQVILPIIFSVRAKKGKEILSRRGERFGVSSRVKKSQIIWIHAASVGEALSSLALIEALLQSYSDIEIMVTTGTVSSALVLETRLPPGAFHQFIPYDHPLYITKFLQYWQPRIALYLESELWPNQLKLIKARNIPLILINAKLSSKSYMRWQFCKIGVAMVRLFDLILCQSANDAEKYSVLGAKKVEVMGNLKFASKPLPINKIELEELCAMIKERHLFVAASTHLEDEREVIAAHQLLLKSFPDLLTIIVPRHPTRDIWLDGYCSKYPHKIAKRSLGQKINRETEIYLADTLGEMGLFLYLADMVFVGGSFSPKVGGHNLIEPASLGAAIIYGPYMHSQQEMCRLFNEAQAAIQVADAVELANIVRLMSEDKEFLMAQKVRAKKVADGQEQILPNVLSKIKPYL
jgi:3-deoxy-D-manno-octulosonic-acid transferase